MESNPVGYYSFIIRSQIEFSAASQAIVVRCILEVPATGERRGFADVDALLDALRTELMAAQHHIIPIDQRKKNSE